MKPQLIKKYCIIACLLVLSGLIFGFSGGFSLTLAADTTPDTCLNNTASEAVCKDCCDCLDNPEERKTCRDACIAKSATTEGFNGNTDLITVNAPSVLGPDGDYSKATGTGNEQDCKTYCDESGDLSCGDRRFCRDACNETFGDGTTPPVDPNGGGNNNNNNNNNGGSNISIDQAVSDEAQRNTIAFDGLAFLTGDACSDTFLPPGKVADFSGFQYLRDTDPTQLGHNTDFVTIIAFNMLNILTESQIAELVALAKKQITMIDQYGYDRFPLMNAFRRLLVGDIPDGSDSLSLTAVKAYSAELYQLDGEISYDRAETLGHILRNMTADQKSALEALKALNGVGNWNKTLTDPLKALHLSQSENVAVMTYASEMYSWYGGSVEADTYFCPERQGTYFGSFYMKDAPAMAAGPGFTIDSNLTADMGNRFIAALSATQAPLVTGLVDIQRDSLMEIVTTRRLIATQLRRFITETSVDKTPILSLAARYGELDGTIVYNYATNFSALKKTLRSEQMQTLTGIREEWNTIPCSGAYLYSAKISMPDVMNTDFLFGVSSNNGGETSVPNRISNAFSFAEGPACNAAGQLFFSDISADRIYKWSADLGLTVFRENSGGANGLYFDAAGDLLACEGNTGRLTATDSSGNVTVLTDAYNGLRYNEPNDLWVTPNGGVYFTDPVYFGTKVQDGEHVYYLSADRTKVQRVISDLVRPNGIIGTGDGETLYVTDHGAGATYRYTINDDGTLANKQIFVSKGGDGMTIDSLGNVYLCAENLLVYDSSGNLLETISVPERPTNACFGGSDRKTLFITTQTVLYSLSRTAAGIMPSEKKTGTTSAGNSSTASGSTGSDGGGCFIGSLLP